LAVSELSAPALPAWVHKRDGRLVPFEADKICQALFAVTETLGRPDAFLARELTDSVLHFLAAEVGGATPSTAQLSELTVKVVRELGQPTLARAFSETSEIKAERRRQKATSPVKSRFSPSDSPGTVVSACLRQYSLEAVFSRDLASAQADGLLTLTCLDAPLGLAAYVLGPADLEDGPDLLEVLEEAREVAGAFVVVDSPEYILCSPGTSQGRARFTTRLQRGLRYTGLRAVVHLHCATPPAWAEDGPGGPLFAARRLQQDLDLLAGTVEALLDSVLGSEEGPGRIRLEWHLGERDFLSAGLANPGLLRAVRIALDSHQLSFRLDRPRRPIVLGPGLDRRHPAVLLAVALHLPQLAQMLGPGTGPDLFLRKLASLARLALSAGSQKRAFLRRQSRTGDGTASAIGRGFLLDRARLVVVPVGLEAVVRRLIGRGIAEDAGSLEFARQIVGRLRAVIESEGSAAGLDTCLDGSGTTLGEWERSMPEAECGPSGADEPGLRVAGLTGWDDRAPLQSQVDAAAALHSVAGGGMATLVLPPNLATPAEELAALLRYAWQETGLTGLRIERATTARQQGLPGLP
jgi:hypothetical protein